MWLDINRHRSTLKHAEQEEIHCLSTARYGMATTLGNTKLLKDACFKQEVGCMIVLHLSPLHDWRAMAVKLAAMVSLIASVDKRTLYSRTKLNARNTWPSIWMATLAGSDRSILISSVPGYIFVSFSIAISSRQCPRIDIWFLSSTIKFIEVFKIGCSRNWLYFWQGGLLANMME